MHFLALLAASALPLAALAQDSSSSSHFRPGTGILPVPETTLSFPTSGSAINPGGPIATASESDATAPTTTGTATAAGTASMSSMSGVPLGPGPVKLSSTVSVPASTDMVSSGGSAMGTSTVVVAASGTGSATASSSGAATATGNVAAGGMGVVVAESYLLTYFGSLMAALLML